MVRGSEQVWLMLIERLQLGEVIKNGSLKVGDASKVLCQTLSNHCSRSRLVRSSIRINRNSLSYIRYCLLYYLSSMLEIWYVSMFLFLNSVKQTQRIMRTTMQMNYSLISPFLYHRVKVPLQRHFVCVVQTIRHYLRLIIDSLFHFFKSCFHT